MQQRVGAGELEGGGVEFEIEVAVGVEAGAVIGDGESEVNVLAGLVGVGSGAEAGEFEVMAGVEGEAAVGGGEDGTGGVRVFGEGEEDFEGVGVGIDGGAGAELEAGVGAAELIDGAGLAEDGIGEGGRLAVDCCGGGEEESEQVAHGAKRSFEFQLHFVRGAGNLTLIFAKIAAFGF
jgi:hypothetical protein